MTDYRNFADSIFSREIWDNEGRFWLIVTLSVLAAVMIALMFARSYRNEFLTACYTWIAISISGVIILVGVFGSFITNDFNRIVAEKNISAKYDASKLKFNHYDSKTKTVRAFYSDKDTSTNKQLTFTFEKSGTEPFLVKYISDDSLIEKAISKAE
jgi:hypothetical protein